MLSISSQSGDGIDKVQSIGGLSFNKYTVKMLQLKTCLYLSKGLAEYVAVLDVDEFFIPKGFHSSFLDVLEGVHSTPSLDNFDSVALQKSRDFGVKVNGQAERHRHPFCFITVNSEVFINRSVNMEVDTVNPWIHERCVCAASVCVTVCPPVHHSPRTLVTLSIPLLIFYFQPIAIIYYCSMDCQPR